MEINELISLTSKYGLTIKEESIHFNESGLDFLVAFAHDTNDVEWTLRIPRRPDVFERTGVEKNVLNLIYKKVPFETPYWEIYEEDLIAYKKLSGVPAGTIDHSIQNYVWELNHEQIPEQFHQSLANILASLHTFSSEEIKNAGLTVHTAEEARQSMKTRMEKVKQTFGVGDSLWNRWETWLQNDSLWPAQTGLIHGDVHAGHIMIDTDEKAIGLIDWTEAKLTDVSVDFVFYYKAFGEDALDKLIHYYHQADGLYWPGMKEHIIEQDAAYAVAIAEFAIISGVKEYEQMAKDALEIK
ncbi:macrolide phosphotransferase [Metabacillus malikii]|uniref:Macrolide phosphotransferase n=2 Tax=Metabacillus malikii TaxID=1504265 RepID=A0ABT9ZMH0_9BACI|nr:macrolide phosphotransferase [Metabacillus malikii]